MELKRSKSDGKLLVVELLAGWCGHASGLESMPVVINGMSGAFVIEDGVCKLLRHTPDRQGDVLGEWSCSGLFDPKELEIPGLLEVADPWEVRRRFLWREPVAAIPRPTAESCAKLVAGDWELLFDMPDHVMAKLDRADGFWVVRWDRDRYVISLKAADTKIEHRCEDWRVGLARVRDAYCGELVATEEAGFPDAESK